MANMNITYQELSNVSNKLKNGQTTIDNELGTLQSAVAQLIASGFTTDQASGAFQSAYDEFTKGTKQVLEGLSEMGQYLDKAVQVYQDADQQLANALK